MPKARRNKSLSSRGRKSFLQPTMGELFLHDAQQERIPAPGYGAYDKYLKAYADEVWVYACVSRRAADVASSPIHLYDKSGKVVEQHEVLTLLDNPNPRMGLTRRTLFQWWSYSLLLSGNAYWLLDELTGRGLPTILWPLFPDRVEIKPSSDPKIYRDGYLYHVGGRPIPLGTSQVKQAFFFNPLDYNYGLAPLAAARLSADTHRASSKHNLRFFDNGARPDLVFTTPHSLTPEQRQRMHVAWMKRHRGESKAHTPAFLEKGTEAKLLGMSPKDADFIAQKKMSREEICSVYGTPPVMVGLFEYANYANSEEQEKIYQRSTVVPDAKGLCEFLNLHLVPLFDRSNTVRFRVDESAVRALQEDEDKRSQYVERYWRMGVPLNQLIKAYKLPFEEVPGHGDRSFVVGVQDAGAVPSEPEAPEPIEEPTPPAPVKALPAPEATKVVPTAAQLKEKHNRFLLLADSLGSPLRVAVRKVFDDQRDAVISALHAAGKDEKPTRASLGIDTAVSNKALAETMAPHLKIGVYAGVGAENALVRHLVGKAYDEHAPTRSRKAEGRVDKWVAKKAFKWAEEINDSTYAKVDGVIEAALAEGLGVEETSARIAEAFNGQRDYRTLRVAQTEMIAALNEGALEAYRENPFVEKKGWYATEDELTRTTHLAAGDKYDEKGAIPVDDDFKVGDADGPTPGQTGDPAEDINCRCSVFPVVSKEPKP